MEAGIRMTVQNKNLFQKQMQNVGPDTDKRCLVSTMYGLRKWIRNVLKLLEHVSILLWCRNFYPEKS